MPPTRRDSLLCARNCLTSANPSGWSKSLRRVVENCAFFLDKLLTLPPRNVQCEPTRFAYAQLGLQFTHDGLATVPRYSPDKQFGGVTTQLVFRQLHSGQTRPKNTQPGIIIKANQTKIFRASQAHFLSRFQQTNSHQMVSHIDSVRSVGEESAPSSIAGLDAVISFDNQLLPEWQPRRH